MSPDVEVAGPNDPAAERDFYRKLLDLGAAEEPALLLDAALATIVNVSGAHAAYLELRDTHDDETAPPRYWRAYGCTDADLAAIRTSISRGIVARALAERKTVATPSATEDPAFRDQPSVLRNAIQAVLCAPIGAPAFGVVYLQGPKASASFTARNREAVELFARQLGAVGARLLATSVAPPAIDPTAEIRTKFRCEGLVGRSEALARALRAAAEVAPPPITVLLTGGVGTGKSALARAIVANSPRATAPYIELNCAAIPEHLMEGELFGAEAGAYTGATKKMVGKVAAAKGGTLFLDEIAELSLTAQAKLLQVLQERIFYPLGSTKAVTTDVRILSATNADLKARVAAKTFREDLYYRLAVMTITVPTLAERAEDIPLLVEKFCVDACARAGGVQLRPTRRALFGCQDAAWPGNIRELGNAVEAGVARALYEKAEVLDHRHLFPALPGDDAGPTSFRELMLRAQRRLLIDALDRNDWHITKTATELDVSRSYLHELIHVVGLERPPVPGTTGSSGSSGSSGS